MRLNNNIKKQISDHAWDCYPDECCGLIVRDLGDGVVHFLPMPNISHDPHRAFEIDAQEYAKMSFTFDVLAIVHSHPDGEPLPSEVDRTQMGLHDVPWVIVGLGTTPTGAKYCDIKSHKPTAYQSPLLGREYHHGLQDCYSLVRDYYSRELDISLPDFKRLDGWWESLNHEPLYETNFGKAGFVAVADGTLCKHDVILCRVGRTHHINHALIFVGDGALVSESVPECVGDCLVLHHPHGRLSVREIYGDSWQKRTAMVVRHRDLMG